MPNTTSTKQRRGPIIISRHGRPALDRNLGPRLHWQGYIDWWARYEKGPLAEGQEAPKELKDLVADADLVFASARLRAQQTADSAAPHLKAMYDPVFNEAPLPPPRLRGFRAKAAALKLHEASAEAKVYLAAHGWFNRMLRPELRQLGWVCTRDGGDSYWSYRVYEYRGQ